MSGDVLDEAYARLAPTAPEYGGGLSNHGPMAAEALVQLGRPDHVHDWLDGYVKHLEPAPATVARPAERPRLGRPDTYPQWLAWFDAELAERPWRDVLAAWLPELTPGLASAAAHGWLRVAHGVHALRDVTTPERLQELAFGLAYWASCFERLPAEPRPAGSLDPSSALRAVPAHPDPASFLISDALRGLADEPAFAPAVDAVDPSQLTIAGIVDAVAPLAIAGGLQIVYVHAITAPSAALLLAGLVPTELDALLTAHAWQTVAALVAAYPVRVGSVRADDPGEAPAIDDLIDRALDCGDEHAIKVVAAAAAAERAGASPFARLAAATLVRSMHG